MRLNHFRSSKAAPSARRPEFAPLFEGLEIRQMFSGSAGMTTLPYVLPAGSPLASTTVAKTSTTGSSPVVSPQSAAGPWTALAGHDLQQVASARMANGRQVAFALGGDGAVYYRVQTANNAAGFGNWESLGGNVASISVTRGVGGKIQVLALGLNQSVYAIGQSKANADAWTGWQGLGGGSLKQLAVSQNNDGRAEVFAVGGDSHVYTKWQDANGNWVGWADLGGSVKSISVAQGLGGRMYCVGIGQNNGAWVVSQNAANGGWGSWKSLGGSAITQVVASQDADGRFETFALGSGNAVYHQWQHYDGSWSGWVSLGGVAKSIAAGLDGGRLVVAAVGTDNAVRILGQTTDNGNFGGWQSLGGSARQISVGNDANGALRVLSLNTDASASYGGPVVTNDPTVKVTTRNGNELVVTASGSAVSVKISQVGGGIEIEADGKITTAAVPAGGLFVYTRNGPDVITIDPSVTCRTTVDTIDAAPTTVFNYGANAVTWADSSDVVSGNAAVRSVGSFAGGVSKALGAALPTPTDGGATHTATGSLFGTGPVIGDVNQRGVGDCWFLSAAAAVAEQRPGVIANDAVDLGDGTYAVAFQRNGQTTYVRVNNQLGDVSAVTGPSGNLWAPIFEKAETYFRRGVNTFQSGGGYVSEGFADLGLGTTDLLSQNIAEPTLFARFTSDLANHVALAFNIPDTCPDLHGFHCYTLTGVQKVNGVDQYVIRNPWGLSADALEDAHGVASLTYAQLTANAGWITEAV